MKPGWQLFPCTTGWEGALRKCLPGLLPAAPQGIDIRAMLAGAQEMDAATHTPDQNTQLLC